MPTHYVFDTSSFIAIENWPVPAQTPALWELLHALVTQSRLFTSEYVLIELKRNNEQAFNQVNAMRNGLVVSIDEELALAAGRFAYQYPRVCRPRRRNNCADPWILAIAQSRGAVLVTEESPLNDGVQRLPHVCAAESIEVNCLADFVAAEGVA